MVGYLVFLTISTAIFALFGLGLNLQWGYTGLINFGHVAFMTIGAYTTVLLSSYLLSLESVPIVSSPVFALLISVFLGIILASVLGWLIGLSTLRLRTDYLAIVTIGVSEVVRLFANNEEWLTRGTRGVQGYPLPLARFSPSLPVKLLMIGVLTAIAIFAGWQLWRGIRGKLREFRQRNKETQRKPFGILILGGLAAILGLWIYIIGVLALYDYTYKAGLMLLSLFVLAVVYWGLELLVNSPWGRVLKSIREDEEIAKALGKDVFWYKLQAFMLGGAIAGIGGAFYAWQLTNVYPTNFEPLVTFNAWTIVVLGGAGNNPGTLLGAIIYWAYDSLTRFVLPQLGIFNASQLGAFRVMIIGLILMVLMVWRPQGILGKKEELTLGR